MEKINTFIKPIILALTICIANANIYAQSWLLAGNSDVTANSKLGTLNSFPVKIFTNGTEKMRIATTGNVGINTINPVSPGVGARSLHLSATNFPQFILQATAASTDNQVWRMIARNDNLFQIQTLSDAFGSEQTAMQITRNGNSITNVLFPAGNVGIGISNPQAKLDVIGDVRIYGLTVGLGGGAIDGNTVFGKSALFTNTGGFDNTAIGYKSLFANTTGSDNTSVGFNSLGDNTTGSFNSAFGEFALYYNLDGNRNTATGFSALYYNQGGADNTANGYGALANSHGSNNTAVGSNSLSTNFIGYDNTAVGDSVLYSNDGHVNTAIGYKSLRSTTTGSFNVATGAYSLYSNISGGFNTAVGYNSLQMSIQSDNNTAIGNSSGKIGLLGIGSPGNNNTFLGAYSGANNPYSNSTSVGYGAVATANNQVMLGNTSVTSVIAAGTYIIYSDGRFKKNIKENVPGLSFINLLRPVTYNYDIHGLDKHIGVNDDSLNIESSISNKEKILYTGFVAQEVENAAKKLNYNFSGIYTPKNDKDAYGLSYADFVVPLVKAVQELTAINGEQKMTNEDLQKQIDELKKAISGSQVSAIGNQASVASDQTVILSASAFLEQNIPNPFNNTTTIEYTLPETYSSAKIIIVDKSGKILKQINLSGKGKGSLNIEVSTLSSGIYNYSLYVDSKLIDIKQMILAK